MDALRTILKWVSRHRTWSIVAALILVAGVVVGRIAFDRTQGTLTEPLKRGPIVDAIYGIGTVTANRSYSIKPGVITTISDLYVKEGDSVRKGSKLAAVDSVVYYAPFDGTVNYLPFKIHENVFTQIPFLVLTDLQSRYIVVTLEQQGALRVHAGQAAKISFDSARDQTYVGKIQSVYSYNGNFLARIDVSTLPPEILPDMTADIAIIVRQIDNALVVPTAAYEGDTVWVKRSHGLPTPAKVTLGVVDGAMAEVLSGDVLEGDRLLIRKKVAQ